MYSLAFLLEAGADGSLEGARARMAARRLVEHYVGLFHDADHARLGVFCVRTEDALDITRWVAEASLRNPYGAAPKVEVFFGQHPNAVGYGDALFFSPSTEWDLASLHHAYLELTRVSDVNAYEGADVSDVYDLDLIAERRRFAPQYEGSVYANSARPPRYRELFAYLAARGFRDSVLDVGCGAGATYGLLRKLCARAGRAVPRYTGLDFSRSHIFRARSNYPAAHFVWGSAAAMTWPSGAFDVAVANSVLNFIPPDAQRSALQRLLDAAHGRVLTALFAHDADVLPRGPSSFAQKFHDIRVLETHLLDAADVRALADAWPDCERVERPMLTALWPDPDSPGMWLRRDSSDGQAEALKAQWGADASALAHGFRAAHGLGDDATVFEATRIELWPKGARACPAVELLPADLHQDDWGGSRLTGG